VTESRSGIDIEKSDICASIRRDMEVVVTAPWRPVTATAVTQGHPVREASGWSTALRHGCRPVAWESEVSTSTSPSMPVAV
jgi:hypothetical protein